jgi:hypothetical protein
MEPVPPSTTNENKVKGALEPLPGHPAPPTPQSDLKSIAAQHANVPMWKDFGYFLLHNKRWWLLPILIILLLLGLLTAVSSTAIAPFIYTVF